MPVNPTDGRVGGTAGVRAVPHAARASATRPVSSTVIPMATSQPKNAAPTFEPPNRSRTPAGTAVTGPVGSGLRHRASRARRWTDPARSPQWSWRRVPRYRAPGNGAWDDGGSHVRRGNPDLELVRRQDVHHAGADPQLLHHRPHRPRQVDAGRPDAAAHRRRRRAHDARPVPRPHGHRARARHHDQGAERAAAVEGAATHRARAAPDRHSGPRRLHLRGQPRAGGVRGRDPAGRRRAGHRGADAGQPLPGDGEGPHDHPGPQQDRPACRRPGPLRRRDRPHRRLRRRPRCCASARRPVRASARCSTRWCARCPRRSATPTPRPAR